MSTGDDESGDEMKELIDPKKIGEIKKDIKILEKYKMTCEKKLGKGKPKSVVDNEVNKLPEESRKYVEKVLLKEIKSAIQSVDEKLNWRLLSLEFSNMF